MLEETIENALLVKLAQGLDQIAAANVNLPLPAAAEFGCRVG